MLDEHRNSKVKGTVGIGYAIQYFTGQGLVVSIPLNDSQPYDLIVDMSGSLHRVQVKTSGAKRRLDSWCVNLRTMGGNQSFHTVKLFDNTSCDSLFILTEDGRKWLIPTSKIDCVNSISVGNKNYNEFELL